MPRRHVAILVLIAVALTVTSLALSRRDSRDWRANRSRRLFPFPWQDAASVVIDRPGRDALSFSRPTGGEWQMELGDGLADSLDPTAVQALEALVTMSWREPLRDRSAPDPDRAITISAGNASGQKVVIRLGDAMQNLRAATVDGDDSVVYGVNQDLLAFLDWPDARFRNMNLATGPNNAKPDRITLTPGAAPDLAITLERTPAGWRQTVPVDWPVDETRLDLLLRWIDRLRGESIEAEQTGDLAWFGFTEESPRVDLWYDSPTGPVRRRIEFGKPVGNGAIYARDTTRNPVFAVPGDTLAEISMDVAKQHATLWTNFYRRRGINLLGAAIPEAVTVERLLPFPEKLEITRTAEAGGASWTGVLTRPDHVERFRLDPPDVNNAMRPLTALFTGLSNLRVKTFLADVPPGPDTVKWTGFPAWRISYRNPGDPTPDTVLTLYAANDNGDLPSGNPFVHGQAEPAELESLPGLPARVGIAFSLSDQPAVMETYGELSYLLCLPPYRYRSAKVIDQEHRNWHRIELIQGEERRVYTRKQGDPNEQWWRHDPDPEPLMDDNNLFVRLTVELSQLRSDGFVGEGNGDIGEFGLDRPERIAIVYTSPEPADGGDDPSLALTLAIGRLYDDTGRRFAQLGTGGPVFLLPARMAEALGRTYH